MKQIIMLLFSLAIGSSAIAQQPVFDYEGNKQLMIQRVLMQYFIILHHDRYDVAHLNDFCDESAENADLAELREIASLVPEEFNWTNRDDKAIMNTSFEVGSIYTCELECTTGETATVQLVVAGEPQQPYLVVSRHLAMAE